MSLYDVEHTRMERETDYREIFQSIHLMVQSFAFLGIFVTASKSYGSGNGNPLLYYGNGVHFVHCCTF